jgi:hypothetical protein
LSEDLAYLGRTLNARAGDTATEIAVLIRGVINQLVPKGQTGAAAKHIDTEAIALLVKKVRDACQFAYNLTESTGPEVLEPITYFAGRVEKIISDEVESKMGSIGLPPDLAERQFGILRGELQRMKNRLLDDYSHGMMGDNRLAKDPLVNVINTQTNSPGALQQVGIGDRFSQTAFSKSHNELVAAIDRALSSPEFGKLKQDQKDAFSDTAAVVKEEAVKSRPDVGKLKRWGTRLVDLSTGIGMKVAAGEIVHLLNSMFGG